MSKLKFFTDEHMDKAVAIQLRQRGIDVLRCEDIGMKSATDNELLEYASQNGYALLSMDDDVTRLHAESIRENKFHGGIFYAPMALFQGQAGIGPIVRYCAEFASLIEGGAGDMEADIHNQLLFIER